MLADAGVLKKSKQQKIHGKDGKIPMKAEIPFSQSHFKFIFFGFLFCFLSLASTEAHNFEVDGSGGLRRGVLLHDTARVSYGNFAAKKLSFIVVKLQ